MELQLQNQQYACYEEMPELTAAHEETAETIIPDYCPDVSRIVDASGCVFLRNREIADGKLSVSAIVRVTLLYMAEDADGLRTFEYNLPITHNFEGRLPEHCANVRMEATVATPDVRLINPRKVLTRVNVELTAAVYCENKLTACCGVEQQQEHGVETLYETRTVSLLQGIREKEFIFSEEISLPIGRETVHELLRTRAKAYITESKLIGSKVILKGVVHLDMLYFTSANTIGQSSAELPFSQIIEGIDGDEGELSARSSVRLTGMELRIGSENAPEDERTVTAKLSLCAFVLLHRTITLCCIADLYSTSCQLHMQTEPVLFSQPAEEYIRQQTVRELIETGTDVQSILSTDVHFGKVALTQENGLATLRVPSFIRVLYLDENATPLVAERRMELSVQMEITSGKQPAVRVECHEISALAGANGIEIRLTAEFILRSTNTQQHDCITMLRAEQSEDAACTNAPSLVLRTLQPQQRLWDLAKQYRTTVGDILSANDLADEAAAPIGEMLLIPRKR